jgi:hypothetical protein
MRTLMGELEADMHFGTVRFPQCPHDPVYFVFLQAAVVGGDDSAASVQTSLPSSHL